MCEKTIAGAAAITVDKRTENNYALVVEHTRKRRIFFLRLLFSGLGVGGGCRKQLCLSGVYRIRTMHIHERQQSGSTVGDAV